MRTKPKLMREDQRSYDELRSLVFTPSFSAYPEGSVLIQQGNTHVLCNVTIAQGVPAWMQGEGRTGGWVTAEYAMLPRATLQRSERETLRPRSRSQEIRRFIGRALRAGIHLERIPPVTCTIDCDVLQADGGTRTAAITGAFVALLFALHKTLPENLGLASVLKSQIAAISVGWHGGHVLLDLDYAEDSHADADVNIVMNAEAELIEVQGTAERGSLPRNTFNEMIDLAEIGIAKLMKLQLDCLRSQGIELELS